MEPEKSSFRLLERTDCKKLLIQSEFLINYIGGMLSNETF